jgi:hypothetical protein
VFSTNQNSEQLTWWLRNQFPGVIYRWDLAADLKLSIGQAARHKRLHPVRGYPDLFLAEPRAGFAGAFFELKADGAKLYQASGKLYADKHLEEQAAMLDSLRAKGYHADFIQGFDESVEKISAYLLAWTSDLAQIGDIN